MKLYTCKDHGGHWPVPVASVVVADDEAHATELLNAELHERHLDPAGFTLQELPIDAAGVRILSDGDY